MKKQPLSSLNTQLGPWAEYVNTYITLIQEQGYAARSIQDQVRVITRLVCWLRRMQVEVCSLDETILYRFLRRQQNTGGARPADVAALHRFLRIVRRQGTTPAKKQSQVPLSHKQRLISKYERYLIRRAWPSKSHGGKLYCRC
jgi:hypothetical protein